jgi:hypothetical protein
MARLNCWDFRKCGRETGGIREPKSGVCAAATEEKFDRINRGRNGGRVCWLIRQMLSERKHKGVGMMNCCRCDFFRLVEKQEGPNFFVYI